MSTARDIIDEISHRLPDKTMVYHALNRAIRMVAKRLKYHGSSRIQGELSVSITAGTSSGSFPVDFWGLLGEPYISGKTTTLQPLPDFSTKLTNASNSTPRFYEVAGSTLNLIPGSSTAITIKGYYFKRPTKITKPSDTIPFDELFDDTIQEALIHIYATGGSSVDANYIGMMENFINKSVDDIMPGLERKTPTRIPCGQNLNYLRW